MVIAQNTRSTRDAGPPGRQHLKARRRHHARSWIVHLAVVLAVGAASIAVGLLVTPAQTVRAVGQTVAVGASAPSLSSAGPGELDLFGQQLPTRIDFAGPIRPRLVLTRITLDRQVASLFSQANRQRSEQDIGQALAAGWTRYFAWEIAIVGLSALLLLGAAAGWLRMPWRRTLLLIGAGLVFVEAVNLGGIMVTAFGTPGRLAHVRSLEALVGRTPLAPIPPISGPARTQVQAVVMGDSTAAGLGNKPLANPTALDTACHRTSDTYANDLATVNHWQVLNLACSGATIHSGILGPQRVGNLVAPPQLAAAKKATKASVVILSIGADDVRWSAILRLCAATKTCDNQAATAYFQRQLADFTPRYYELLKQLATLPSHPKVLVNLYYNPFDTHSSCLDHLGITQGKQQSLISLLHTLNGVLAKGAHASSFTAVQPSFAGHRLCDAQPYVQGIKEAAPFHPTASGELAIALADEQALQQGPRK